CGSHGPVVNNCVSTSNAPTGCWSDRPTAPLSAVATSTSASPTVGASPTGVATSTVTVAPPPAPVPTTQAPPSPPPSPVRTTGGNQRTTGASVYYPNCDAARAAGVAPLYRGEPGYRSGLDRDGDGVACE